MANAEQKENQVVHSKYRTKGAYHWREIARNPFTYSCFTAGRYQIALDLAGNLTGKTVLDFGCGDAAFLSLASKSGGECTGLEPDEEGRRFAEKELAERGYSISVVDSVDALTPGSFDLVFLLEVIEHVDDPDAMLKTCKDLLKPGGALVITTPTRLTETPLDSEHVQEYFPNEFFEMLGRHFTVEKAEQKIPLAAAELNLWSPRIVFNKPILGWLMNLIAILFKRNPIFGIGTFQRYHVQLAARCRKE
jgi:2-polyprenyl-3-methyl-5-hydroxy-6-metoxy-1,4-benzoquinol methylase